ncbi:PA0069 family radical SAM protein [Marivirga arenosa]|uniref:PA0069 family radical SAM protein n=1 Tax=Marivirga arenosa TaxID=3059076 RepID=A0AA51ZWE3_9BACT|nr:PA0069 family radical SAM protein [Marivirga sp. BKB1-2]WNB17906.1 PA0069 family radical SAM protein [Marivirga sp. BKB1-2]
MKSDQNIKGRGAQHKLSNSYLKQEFTTEWDEGIDEYTHLEKPKTQIFYEYPKKIINKVSSPDVGMEYSINPYQGCEHGCVYCYARNSHEYWGWDAGLDFESKIIVKKNAPSLLEKELLHKNWKVKPIVLSGNTDCYQPIEKKLRITRSLLQVLAKYRHPVGIITKNVAVLDDLDILIDLAKDNLIRVIFSITSLDEKLRSVLEPRTASAAKKLNAIKVLSESGIPVSVMNAPIIPGLNHHEIPEIIKRSAEHGAIDAGYTVVRLNGRIAEIFKKWLENYFPERFDKIWHQIQSLHNGNVNDSNWGQRMKGNGNESDIIKQLFYMAKRKHMNSIQKIELNTHAFRRGGAYTLF